MCKESLSRLKDASKELWSEAMKGLKEDILGLSRISVAVLVGAFIAFVFVTAFLVGARLVKGHHEQAVIDGFSKTVASQQATIKGLNDQVSSLKQQLGQKKDAVVVPPVTGQPVIHGNGSDISVVTVVTIPQPKESR